MISFGKIIDKLIEVSTSGDLSKDAKDQLDVVIDELVDFEMKHNGGLLPIDFKDLSPEEMEEIKQFEMFVRDVINNKLAMA